MAAHGGIWIPIMTAMSTTLQLSSTIVRRALLRHTPTAYNSAKATSYSRGIMSGSTPGRAIMVESLGDPSVLRVKDITTPAPGLGEVLVHVEAAGVNPVDTYIRSGTYAAGPSLPYIPGKDGAGTVLAVGPDVTKLQVGNRVYLTTSVTGTYATHCIAKASHAHRLPDNVDFLEGACVGVPYHTAYRGLFQKGQAKEGSKVFIHGASGGVGLAATQLAKAKGCLVVGSAGTPPGMELVKKNGAHEVVCHREDGYLDKAQQLAPDGYNVILEMLANQNLENDFRIAAKAAHIAIIGNRGSIAINPRSIMAKELHVDGVMLYAATEEEEKEAAADIFKVLSSGAAPVVAKTFTLEEAPEAHEQKRGSLLIRFGGDMGDIPAPPPPPPSQEIRDITDLLAKPECFCLNQDPKYPWTNLFIGDDRLQLRSDTDEQLILHLVFNETVRLHSIDFVAPELESAPATVKLYLNQNTFGFNDADTVEPVQVLELVEEDLRPDKVTLLKFVKFQRCAALTIFVESNNGAEYTSLSKLRLFGVPMQGTDVSKIKKQPES